VRFAQYDEMVETFQSDRPDQSFRKTVLLPPQGEQRRAEFTARLARDSADNEILAGTLVATEIEATCLVGENKQSAHAQRDSQRKCQKLALSADARHSGGSQLDHAPAEPISYQPGESHGGL
jgi:hypothetical protein